MSIKWTMDKWSWWLPANDHVCFTGAPPRETSIGVRASLLLFSRDQRLYRKEEVNGMRGSASARDAGLLTSEWMRKGGYLRGRHSSLAFLLDRLLQSHQRSIVTP